MKLKRDAFGNTHVELSERNLLSLLTKLYTKGSARTIATSDCYDEHDKPINGESLYVMAATDEEHYEGRAYGPGPMHPVTERMVKALKESSR